MMVLSKLKIWPTVNVSVIAKKTIYYFYCAANVSQIC